MPDKFPGANRGPTPGLNGVPLGHQQGDSSLGSMYGPTEIGQDVELAAPYGFFPRRQFFRPGTFPLPSAQENGYEAPVIEYMGPNIIGRKTTQSGSNSRIANLTSISRQEVSGW